MPTKKPKTRKVKQKAKQRKGFAIVIALIYSSILIVLGLSMLEPLIRDIRVMSDRIKQETLKYAVDAGTEKGQLVGRQLEIGESDVIDETISTSIGDVVVTGTVEGVTDVNEEASLIVLSNTEGPYSPGTYYTIPALGTGDVGRHGEFGYCGINRPVNVMVDSEEDATHRSLENALKDLYPGLTEDEYPVSKTTMVADNLDDTILDWPCHWNKIKEGEVVEIPFYVIVSGHPNDTNADGYLDPDELNLDNFYVRIRPACKPVTGNDYQEICDNTDRYIIIDLDGSTTSMDKEDTIVSWSIDGTQLGTGDDVLLQSHHDDLFVSNRSYITPNRINNFDTNPYSNYVVLNENSYTDGIVGTFRDDSLDIETYLPVLHEGTLSLSVIHTLEDQAGDVPYLEYQLLVPCDTGTCVSAVGDVAKIIKVEAEIDNVKISQEEVIPRKPGVVKFVIHQ